MFEDYKKELEDTYQETFEFVNEEFFDNFDNESILMECIFESNSMIAHILRFSGGEKDKKIYHIDIERK